MVRGREGKGGREGTGKSSLDGSRCGARQTADEVFGEERPVWSSRQRGGGGLQINLFYMISNIFNVSIIYIIS
jgi:hypothetical protein